MSLREALNKRPMAMTVVAAAFVIGIAGVIWWQARNLTPPKPGAYFTIDDGATVFEGDPRQVTPFDYKGKQAVRAHVFRGPDGKTFVGYLERNTPESGAIIKRVQNRNPNDPPPTPAEMGLVLGGKEYKKPGDKEWVGTAKGAEVRRITTVTAPDGSPAIAVE